MGPRTIVAATVLLVVAAVACSPRDAGDGTPTASPGPTNTPAPTLDLTPTATPTPTPSPTPSASATPEPTATPTPTPKSAVTFEVDGKVPAREQALVEFGIGMAETHAERLFGGAVERPMVVQLAGEGVCIGGATAVGYRICINAVSESWQSIEPERLKLKVAAHEYFHVWQHEQFCYREPKWLFEGAAEWFGYEAIIEHGLVEELVASVEQQQVLQQEPVLEPLAEQEVLFAAPQPRQYALWYFAAKFLLDRPGRDRIEGLQRFCEGRADDLPWQDAFEDAFGMTPVEYYEDFERYRADFLPYSAPGRP